MVLASTLVCLGTLLQLGAAKVQFLGMAISGGDFGCQIDGSCPTGSSQLPLSSFGMGGGDGEGQMKHFSQNNGINMFRLPISWQFLVNNNLGGNLDVANFAKYDKLVQTCLATGAYCMIDIHNFARWNSGIIGQGGPTDDQFVSLWRQLATKYAKTEKVVFELMNEPHHLDVQIWAATCQKVITAIREAGAVKQMILLPGSNFDSAATLVTAEGGAEALMALTNPDGSTDNLLLDVHKYLDNDNSGTHAECVTNNIDAFQQVADFLRRTGRKGLVSETGAPPSAPECMTRFCEQNAFINRNLDVFVGLVGWAAGSFDTSYLLSMTPRRNNGRFENNALATECFIGTWKETPEDVKAGNGTAISSMTRPATTLASATNTFAIGNGTSTATGSSIPTSSVTPSGTVTTTGTRSAVSPTTTTSHGGDWTLIITVGTNNRRPMPSTLLVDDVPPSTSQEVLLTDPAAETGVGNFGGRTGGDGGVGGGSVIQGTGGVPVPVPRPSSTSISPTPSFKSGGVSRTALSMSATMVLSIWGVVGWLQS